MRSPRTKSVIKKCAICNTEFKVWQSYIKRGHGKYCSKKCFLINKNKLYTYTYDINFIKRNDELSAYFWGLFVSDGHYSKKEEIKLGMIDVQIIKDIVQKIKYTGTISIDKRKPPRKPFYSISLRGPIVEFIRLHGYTAGSKTGKEFIPVCIDNITLPHFIRGLWDGDGCLSFRQETNKILLIASVCCANKDLLLDLVDRLRRLNIVSGGTIGKHSKGIFYLRFGHKDSLHLCDYMYSDATIKLERKYANYTIGKQTGIRIPQKEKLCSIPGCTNSCIATNLCQYHYFKPVNHASYIRNKSRIQQHRRENKKHINYLARCRYKLRTEIA